MLKNAEKIDIEQHFRAFFVSFAEYFIGEWAFFVCPYLFFVGKSTDFNTNLILRFMRIKRILATIATIALGGLAAQHASAQDLLARQAPIDRKMKAVDTLVLQSILDRENGMIPSSDLYAEWENSKVHNRQASIPDNFTIDLREFSMPTVSRVVTSNYGPRWGRTHEGLDIKVYTGDTIRAAFPGKVRIVKYDRGYGRYIVIRHENGLETVYGHLSRQLVREEQDVASGEPIGLGGSTGVSTGSHLHFETLLNGVPINPALLFDFRAQDVTGDFYTYNRDTYRSESSYATRERGKIGNGGYTREEVQGPNATYTPVKQEAPARRTQYHKVKKGETLSSIARKHGTTVKKLCSLNHLGKKTKVRVGQIIRYS